MSVVKVIEVMAQSPEGWEDATQQAFAAAKNSVRNITSIWVKELKADVENDAINNDRVTAKVSFVLEE